MRAKTWKALIVAALAVVILTAAVGGTMAWLSTKTNDLTNTFVPAKVTCAVDEPTWVNGKSIKENVSIKNTGTTDAYIRVAVIGNWYKNGKVVAGWTDDIKYKDGWFTKEENGVKYHYYKYSVPSVAQSAENCSTSNLFDSYTPTRTDDVPDGAHFEMNIICQAVQSTPAAAVQDAWGVKVNADGTLSAK